MNRLLDIEFQVRSTDGTLCGAYLKLRQGRASRTDEIVRDVLLADYDSQDNLLGIDILAPLDVAVVLELVEDPAQRSTLKKILQHRLSDLLCAA